MFRDIASENSTEWVDKLPKAVSAYQKAHRVDYFRGHSLSLIYEQDVRKSSYRMDMLPGNGWIFKSKISYEWNQFMDGFAVSEEYSTFGANFVPHNTATSNDN